MSDRQAVPRREGYSQWFMGAVFVTCLIIANVAAVKRIGVLGVNMPTRVRVFPVGSGRGMYGLR